MDAFQYFESKQQQQDAAWRCLHDRDRAGSSGRPSRARPKIPAGRGAMGFAVSASHRQHPAGNRRHQPSPTRWWCRYFLPSQNANASGSRPSECFSSSCAHARRLLGKGQPADERYNVIRAQYGDSTEAQAAARQPCVPLGLEANFFHKRRQTAD